jgi:beta-lactamase superfamily II metal-dependent hydrolase
MFVRIFTLWVAFFSFVELGLAAQSLQMLVVRVGQANCVVLRKDSAALLVDCGVHQLNKKLIGTPTIEPVINSVLSFMNGCTSITAVVTHTHYDHFSLITTLAQRGLSLTNNEIFCPGYPKGPAYDSFVRGVKKQGLHITKVVNRGDIKIINALGEGIAVVPIVPSAWSSQGRMGDANDNSLPLVIIDHRNGKKILLTGDASALTLDWVLADICRGLYPEDLLQDIDCMVVPHHGSNLKGGLSWIPYVKDEFSEGHVHPLVSIVSSNPEEADHLPWGSVLKLKLYRGDQVIPAKDHEVHTAWGEITIDKPLFVTSKASRGYFHVVIDKGILNLGDGDLIDGNQEDCLLFSTRIESAPTSSSPSIEDLLKAALENPVEHIGLIDMGILRALPPEGLPSVLESIVQYPPIVKKEVLIRAMQMPESISLGDLFGLLEPIIGEFAGGGEFGFVNELLINLVEAVAKLPQPGPYVAQTLDFIGRVEGNISDDVLAALIQNVTTHESFRAAAANILNIIFSVVGTQFPNISDDLLITLMQNTGGDSLFPPADIIPLVLNVLASERSSISDNLLFALGQREWISNFASLYLGHLCNHLNLVAHLLETIQVEISSNTYSEYLLSISNILALDDIMRESTANLLSSLAMRMQGDAFIADVEEVFPQ